MNKRCFERVNEIQNIAYFQNLYNKYYTLNIKIKITLTPNMENKISNVR
jgi:hypothetical protein